MTTPEYVVQSEIDIPSLLEWLNLTAVKARCSQDGTRGFSELQSLSAMYQRRKCAHLNLTSDPLLGKVSVSYQANVIDIP